MTIMSKTYYDSADLKKFGKITEWNEELGTKFFDYYGKVFEEGALTCREKSLIALAFVIFGLCKRQSNSNKCRNTNHPKE